MTKRPMERPSGMDTYYDSILWDISNLIHTVRTSSARSVNVLMTAAYWLVGRRIVECEQEGRVRAGYGEQLIGRLAKDLSARFGRGYSYPNLNRFRQFYLAFPPDKKLSTPPKESGPPILSTPSRESGETAAEAFLKSASQRFPLPWSAYVRLLAVKNEHARLFYESEAIRGGWSVRQLDRQINSQFYERTALSRNKAAMLAKGQQTLPEDHVSPEEEIKDPYVLEFLGLKDEYSEIELEEALIHHLEAFLLELGGDFCFIGRQRRLRISGALGPGGREPAGRADPLRAERQCPRALRIGRLAEQGHGGRVSYGLAGRGETGRGNRANAQGAGRKGTPGFVRGAPVDRGEAEGKEPNSFSHSTFKA